MMNIRNRWRSGPLLLALTLVLTMFTFPSPAGASEEEICYVFADAGNRLGLLDRAAPNEIPLPNAAGVPDIEAIELDPTSGILYAIDADELGTIDRTTGVYSAIGTIGSGNPGPITMSDVDSMTFGITGTLWAVNASGGPDELFQINPATGALVPDAFGPGIDYLPVTGGFDQIDDIGMDPATGILYGIHTTGSNDQLVTINTTTGAAIAVGTGTGIADMEGMTFDTTGQLIGTTGNAGLAATNNSFFRVDKATGLATFELALGASGADYEAVTCMTQGIDVSDLELTKDVDNASPIVGQTVTFTIEVVNQGEDDATGVEVTDQLPAGLSYISDDSGGAYNSGTGVWTIGALANGATATLQIQAQVTAAGSITNVAEVSASDNVDQDSIPGNDDGDQSEDDEDAATVTAVSAPLIDLSLSKAASDTNPDVGDTITFTVTLANAGPDDASSVAVEDTLPAGYSNPTNISNGGSAVGNTITWTGLSVAAGDSLDLTFDVTVDAPTGAANEYLNVAEVTAANLPDADSTPDNDDGDQSEDDEANASITTPGVADLSLSKTPSDTTPEVGDTITFTITVSNAGPDAATGVAVEDTLPAGYSSPTNISSGGSSMGNTVRWTGLSVAAGDTLDLTFDVTVDAPTGASDEYLNVAEVIAADRFDPDSTPNNDDGDQSEDDEANAAVTPAIIGIAKSVATVTNLNGTYLVTYLINIENLGLVTISDLVVTDDLASQLVAISPIGFTATSGSLDANLAWDGTGATNILSPGQSLDPGESGTVMVSATVTPAGDLGPHFNQAMVAGSDGSETVTDTSTNGFDPDPNGDGVPSEADPTPVSFTEDPAIGLAKAVTSGPTHIGSGVYSLTFTFVLENTGDVDLTGVQVDDDLASVFAAADAFSVTSISSTDLTVNSGFDGDADQDLLVGSDTLTPGQVASIEVVVSITPGSERGPYQNTAEASGTSPASAVVTDASQDGADVDPDNDGDPTNNDEPTPVSFPELGAVEGRVWLDDDRDGVQDPAESGIAGASVGLVDPGPDGVVGGGDDTVVAMSVTASDGQYSFGAIDPDDYFVVIDTTTLPADLVATFDPDGTLDDMTPVTVSAGETSTGNDFGYDTSGFDLALTKTAGTIDSDGELIWTITVTNNGPDAADAPITLTDELPGSLGFVAIDAPGTWACSVSAQTVTCTRAASMAVGVTEQIELTTSVDAESGTTITNEATVSAASADADVSNNTDTASITVGSLPFTGFSVDRVALLALEALALGGVLLLLSRRRRQAHTERPTG